MSTSPPTPRFSDTPAQAEGDWARARGDEAVLLEGTALAKLLVIALVALAVALGVLAQKQLAEERSISSGLLVWAAALSVFAGGLWQAKAAAAGAPAAATDELANPVKERTISLALELALVGAAVGIGIFYSVYRIADIPPGLNHDAAWEGLHAIRIRDGFGAPYSPYVPEAWGRETTFHYFVAFIQLFMGPSKLAIQMSSIIIGLVTLPFFYLMLRRLFDTRLALIGTFLLGVSGWHITMNRVGWRSSLVPLFYVLVFYFLIKAVQERKPRDFILAGVFLGLSVDTYDAARIIPIIAGVYLLYELVRNRSLLLKHYPVLALFGLAALVGFSPLGWYAFSHWDQFTSRSEALWVGNQVRQAGSLDPLFTNLKDALLMFNYRANGNDFFVEEPLLDMPVTVFFTLGLALSVTRWRQRGSFLLIAMLALTLVIGVVAEPNGNRNIGALIPTTAFAAVFLFECWRWLREAYPRYGEWMTAGLLGVLIFVGWTTYDSYLGPDRRDQWGFYPETTRVGRYMHDIAPEYDIHAAAGNWPRDALTYLSYQGEGDPFILVYTYTTNAGELLAVAPSLQRGTAYIIENVPENDAALQALREAFPTATSDAIYYPDGSTNVIANVLLVPPDAGDAPQIGETIGLPQAGERDANRREDLTRIAAALAQYKTEHGAYPDTSDNPQTVCVYSDLDALCIFREELTDATLQDPRGDPGKYGYWYASDGQTYTIFASMEEPVAEGETCTPSDSGLADQRNLLCIHGD